MCKTGSSLLRTGLLALLLGTRTLQTGLLAVSSLSPGRPSLLLRAPGRLAPSRRAVGRAFPTGDSGRCAPWFGDVGEHGSWKNAAVWMCYFLELVEGVFVSRSHLVVADLHTHLVVAFVAGLKYTVSMRFFFFRKKTGGAGRLGCVQMG